jgi:hypothetical protein
VLKRPIRKKITGLPAFTTVKGGAYFFLPGLKALRYLARLGEGKVIGKDIQHQRKLSCWTDAQLEPRVDDLQYVVRWHRQPEIFLVQDRHDVMPHENRIGQSAWDYGTVKIIMIATLAVSPVEGKTVRG